MPVPCSDHAVLLKATAQYGRRETAELCCGLENKGMVGAWHGHGMTSVNQTRPHCVNQMRKTHSKPLAARNGRGTEWARHWNSMLCVNRPLVASTTVIIGVLFGRICEKKMFGMFNTDSHNILRQNSCILLSVW